MEDEDSIAPLLDFEVWFVPRGSERQSSPAHASTSQQEPSGPDERAQAQQQSTKGAQPSGNEETPSASGRQTRGKQRGGRARGGRHGSAGRQPASKMGNDTAEAEEEEDEGPSKRARAESDTPANQGPTVPGTVVLRTSKFALCAHSKVLRPILATCKQAKLEVPYDSQEHLEAGKMLVQLLHDLAVSPDLKKLNWDAMPLEPSLIVRTCRWADLWNVPTAVEMCLDRLGCCKLPALSATDISSILDLPSAVTTKPRFAKAKEKCAAWLLRYCSDVPKIIANEELRASFCSNLSFAAVALWAEQDGLTVHSENKVAVLLSFWYDAQDSVSDEEAAELSELVRVGQMTRSFRHFILPKLAWFGPPVPVFPFNMACDKGGAKAATELCASADELPPAWMGSARKPWPGSGELTFVFQKSDLEGLLADVAAKGEGNAYSAKLPYSGFSFILNLSLERDGSLGAFLWSSNKPPIPAPETVYVSYSMELVKADGSSVSAMEHDAKWLDKNSGWGPVSLVDDKLKSSEDFSRLFGESLQVKVKFAMVE